jgi:hypothetical protein
LSALLCVAVSWCSATTVVSTSQTANTRENPRGGARIGFTLYMPDDICSTVGDKVRDAVDSHNFSVKHLAFNTRAFTGTRKCTVSVCQPAPTVSRCGGQNLRAHAVVVRYRVQDSKWWSEMELPARSAVFIWRGTGLSCPAWTFHISTAGLQQLREK